MENADSNQATCSQNQFSSFFKSSCTGTGSENHLQDDLIARNDSDGANSPVVRPRKERRSGGQGGYTYCVPGCYNNSKRDNHLSFYNFPDGKSSEKELLRKKWIHAISR